MPTATVGLRALLGLTLLALALAPGAAHAQAGKTTPGEMRWALHVTLASRWLDPAETEAFSTPFMVMYALHDAMVKPMPGGLTTPSLAESWSEAKDHLSYTFVLRKGVRFHNGDPVTADDVKFSWDRYKGASAKLLKDKVRDVEIVNSGTVRFVLREPWPDFITFYGTTASGAGW
ncbi:MAG TPA: ABC transporter substrate-binding protein, partial [Candidatus Eisenbacteria bacterium]|nr:ABC transporter substrate-binding protein [Candidatus Eisenbacteria bacterium]